MNKKPVSKLRQQMAENFTTQLNALKTSLSTKINEKPSFVQALIACLKVRTQLRISATATDVF